MLVFFFSQQNQKHITLFNHFHLFLQVVPWTKQMFKECMIGKNISVTKRVSLNGRLAIRKSEKCFPFVNKNMQIF